MSSDAVADERSSKAVQEYITKSGCQWLQYHGRLYCPARIQQGTLPSLPVIEDALPGRMVVERRQRWRCIVTHRNGRKPFRYFGVMRRGGEIIADPLLTHLAPVGWQHINLTGDYLWDSDSGLGPDGRSLRTTATNPSPALAA